MKHYLAAVAVLVAMSLPSLPILAGTGFMGQKGSSAKYTLNDKIGSNSIKFVSDAPAEKINGTADGVTGSFTLDPTNLEATSGTIEVRVRSMKTAISKRDEHMYSPLWLDADAHPKAIFKVAKLQDVVVQVVDGRNVATAKAVGTFEIHGVSKPIVANITLTYLPESAETKKRASGNLVMVKATFTVSLSDFKITGKAGVIGKNVGEKIEIEANLFANS